jgi:hypothetical protein
MTAQRRPFPFHLPTYLLYDVPSACCLPACILLRRITRFHDYLLQMNSR